MTGQAVAHQGVSRQRGPHRRDGQVGRAPDARVAHVLAAALRPLREAGRRLSRRGPQGGGRRTESIAIEKTRLKQAVDPMIPNHAGEMSAQLDDRRRAIEAELERRSEAEDRMARRLAEQSPIPGIAGAHLDAGSSSKCRSCANRMEGSRSLAGIEHEPSKCGLLLDATTCRIGPLAACAPRST